MSSFINKAKDKIADALEKNQNKDDNVRSDNYGPHSSNYANKADPRIDSDRDNRNDPTSRVGGYGNTQVHDQYGDTRGAAGVTSTDTYGSRVGDPGYDDPRSSNTGPHSSNLLNKLDPRQDSDRDSRNDPTSRAGGYGNTQQYGDNYPQTGGAGGFGTTDTTHDRTTGSNEPGYSGHGSTHHPHAGATGGLAANTRTGYGGAGAGEYTGSTDTYDNARSTNTGPHNSNLLNKLDPRHDSDNDHRGDPTSRVGGYGGQTDTYGGYDSRPGYTESAGLGGRTEPSNTYDNSRSANTGPHNSNLMNKMDPRVDSDNDNRNDPTSRVGGYGTTAHGTTQGYGRETTNTAGGYGTTHHQTTGGYNDSSYTPGSGDADRTAGPHNSNLLNKLDPRVDSDMDGSKTYGGQATYR